jgi:murein DD-endopeptidase MepM/ murein hydrolase activator NlpD
MVACALILGACGSVFGGDDPTATPTITPVPPTATPVVPDLTVFRNFSWPIADGCLPEGDQLMPNAPREYRSGTHEGVDFYQYDNCAEITPQTPVLAAKDGVIERIDIEYTPLTQEEFDLATARIADGGANDFEVVDLFRGRQIWINHGNGILTRYAHLIAVTAGLEVGDEVAAGTVIAIVGDSGTPESLSNPGTEIHLHFELRTGDSYLAAGLSPEETRTLYQQLFEPFP